MSAREFSLQLDREWLEAREDIAEDVAKIGLEAFTRIVQRSPVDTGRFKNNWDMSIGGQWVERMPDPSGTAAMTSAVTTAENYPDELPVITIYNGLPYASLLEDGRSLQAPSGMVALTVVELESAL